MLDLCLAVRRPCFCQGSASETLDSAGCAFPVCMLSRAQASNTSAIVDTIKTLLNDTMKGQTLKQACVQTSSVFSNFCKSAVPVRTVVHGAQEQPSTQSFFCCRLASQSSKFVQHMEAVGRSHAPASPDARPGGGCRLQAGLCRLPQSLRGRIRSVIRVSFK